jgi:hypothetical protein
MPTQIEIKCSPSQSLALEIRTLFCRESTKKPNGDNPLSTTNFNELLNQIAQAAFEEGLIFRQKFPKLDIG